MRRELFIFIAVLALTAAMVPRLRRAVNLEEEFMKTAAAGTREKICMPQTPCAWSVYITRQKIIDTKVENAYCNCAAGTKCQINEDDENVNAFIHRCRPLNPNEENAES
ncbi:uncharacterized protein [Battus philenor]|uniref:uncharacterized protein n=1 Tax=Battus philenor TaxID=42288 RepID=UPI0035D0C43A